MTSLYYTENLILKSVIMLILNKFTGNKNTLSKVDLLSSPANRAGLCWSLWLNYVYQAPLTTRRGMGCQTQIGQLLEVQGYSLGRIGASMLAKHPFFPGEVNSIIWRWTIIMGNPQLPQKLASLVLMLQLCACRWEFPSSSSPCTGEFLFLFLFSP